MDHGKPEFSISKYDTRTAERLDEDGFGPSEEAGSVDELGWYGLYRPGGEDDWLKEPVILYNDSQGFVYTITADYGGTIEDKWGEILSEYDEFYREIEEIEEKEENDDLNLD